MKNGTGWLLIFSVVWAALLLLLCSIGNTEEVAAQGRSTIMWMVGRWNWAGADMSHGWLIPIVSLFMVWWRRGELVRAAKGTSWPALLVVVSAALLYLGGMRVQQTRIVLFSLIVMLWSVPFFLFGRRVAAILLYPCAYLVFCIPMTFLDSLTFPLRLISTTISAGFLNGLGVAVTQVGTAIHVNAGAGFALDVAHPCSGLRYLLAMVALTVAYAFFSETSPVKRVVLCVGSIPIAVFGNVARITLIAVAGMLFGRDFALGFYHDYSGYVVFVVAILLMLGLSNLLNNPALLSVFSGAAGRTIVQSGACEQGGSAGHGDGGAANALPVVPVWPSVLLFFLFSMTVAAAFYIQKKPLQVWQAADVCQQLPDRLGEWQGQDLYYCQNAQCARSFAGNELAAQRTCTSCGSALGSMSIGEKTLLPADTVIVRKSYSRAGGEKAIATIVISGSEQRSIHRPQQCLPAQGFAVERSEVIEVPVGGRRTPLCSMLIHAARGADVRAGSRMILAYWFMGGGHETHSHLERLALMAWDNVFRGIRARWAYVSVQMPSDGLSDEPERQIRSFIQLLYPRIKPETDFRPP